MQRHGFILMKLSKKATIVAQKGFSGCLKYIYNLCQLFCI
ncbi:hypothetical protein GCWU000324_02379 [Kingella oralis ATCC 51147]|uniref:Uncharacterized protein n=1 Tax=Kingella oralis ATCC 51147 TaxID=629741 RepID=C4GK04_9NEIS|nr:hypothetical protein GCWU000324_02379 [Kingella oralis ATCC 51147]